MWSMCITYQEVEERGANQKVKSKDNTANKEVSEIENFPTI